MKPSITTLTKTILMAASLLWAGATDRAQAQDGSTADAAGSAPPPAQTTATQAGTGIAIPGMPGVVTPPVPPPPPPAENQTPPTEPPPADTPENVAVISGRQEAAGSSVGEFQLTVDADARMLRLHAQGTPERSDVEVIIGEEFVTEVGFDNKAMLPFDEIRIILSYDVDSVEPIALNDSDLAPFIDGEPTAEVDPLFGMILYEARLRQPVMMDRKPILSIRWQTKRVILETRIEFSSRDEFYTALNFQGRDILGNERVPGDGTLNMNVTILPSDPREREAMLTNPSLFTRPNDKMGGVRLFLQPQPEPIIAGKPFYVDVVLDNRAFSMLDAVNLLIGFDNQLLQIIDVDRDNWITRETNILDGLFRDQWPWDFHIDNSVHQFLGAISYRVGTSDGELTRGQVGPIARIHAVAKRPTEGTAMLFKFSKRPRVPSTSVVYVGEDVLGDPRSFGDGARGILLRVLPEEYEYILAARKQEQGNERAEE
jgi:hypothetical protein